MRRDFNRLDQDPFDLLVIGGGVYGAWLAYDAALRGLRTALVERTDWAAATSSASTKLIHGGLRYLELGHLGLVRKTLDERRRLAELGPHRVHPLRFALPVYRGDRVGKMRLRLGLWVYDRLAGARQPVGPHRALDRREMTELFPMLDAEGLTGGFTYGDCQVDDARFTLEIVDGAAAAGAAVVNRAHAEKLLTDGRRVVGAAVQDGETGRRIEVRAGVVVDCSGPWSGRLDHAVEPRGGPAVRLTKGVHLVMPALPVHRAFLLSSNSDRRIVFLVPWYGRTLLGTTDTDYLGDPDDVRVEPADVAYLLAAANGVLRHNRWSESDVLGSFAGLRTLPATGAADPSSVSREWTLSEPLERLLVSLGGKFTSARADAAEAVDRAVQLLGRRATPCRTSSQPLPWCPTEPFGPWSKLTLCRGLALGMDEATVDACQRRHGSRIERIFARIEDEPVLARRIVPELPFCMAEIVHAAEDEMATSLEDVLRRRVPMLILGGLDQPALHAVAERVGRALGWSADRRELEAGEILHRAGVHEDSRQPVVEPRR